MLKSPSKQTFLKLDVAAFSKGETLHINCDTSPLGGLYARMNRILLWLFGLTSHTTISSWGSKSWRRQDDMLLFIYEERKYLVTWCLKVAVRVSELCLDGRERGEGVLLWRHYDVSRTLLRDHPGDPARHADSARPRWFNTLHSEHDMLTKCWFNVGLSSTLDPSGGGGIIQFWIKKYPWKCGFGQNIYLEYRFSGENIP